MMQTDYSCSGNLWLRSTQLPYVLLLLPYYALTFIGPREAKTGDPLDNVLTATLATMLPMSVFMIASLFFFAAFDKVFNPALRLPAKRDCTAVPASTCEIKASAVPVSITFIPNCLGALRLALPLRLTMPRLLSLVI